MSCTKDDARFSLELNFDFVEGELRVTPCYFNITASRLASSRTELSLFGSWKRFSLQPAVDGNKK